MAKNCISVGGTMNGENSDNMADFSSRGPASDGRLKPDVTAPAVGVWSAEGGDPGGELDTYKLGSGTSMATPMVAASAALTRQYFMDGWYPTGTKDVAHAFTPSAALVKAILINGAVEMTGVGAYGMGQNWYPNNNQGWGRILLDNALHFQGDTRGLVIDDDRSGINTGATVTYELAIGDVSMPVEITLVWSDYPGVAYTNPNLVNDLDLVVIAPDGTYYVGNAYQGHNPGESIPNPGGANFTGDRLNNVESVLVLTDVQAGLWRIEISGYNVPMGPQPYAIVMTGGIATQKGVIQMCHGRYQSSATVNIRAVDTDLNVNPAAPDTAWAWMSSTTESTAENITLVETGDATCVFTASIQLENSAVPVPGDGVLQVQNGDMISAAYYDDDDGLGGSGWTYDTAVVDDDPPAISGVGVINIRFNRATVVWTTDEASDSVAYYGKRAPPTSTKSDSRRTTAHSISISMLDENTTYCFAVQSTDEAGNAAYDDNSTMYYWFKTTVRPPTAPPDIEWPTFHNNQPRQGVSPSVFEPPLMLRWSSGPHLIELWTSPVLKGGVLYTTTLDGYIRALDPYSGEILWARHLGGMYYYTGTPTVENGAVFATFYGGAGGYLYALDADTGETIWTLGPASGLDFNARIAMASADGLVFGSTWAGQIFALNAADGSIEWIYSAPGLPWGGPTVNQGMLYMPCDNMLLAVDEFSGTLLWSTMLDEICAAPPLFAQGNIYEGTYGGTMYAIDAVTGDVVWTTGGFGLIDYSTPAYDGSAIYFAAFGPGSEGMYVSLDATTGDLLWQTWLEGAPTGSSVAYANGYIYGTCWDGYLRVLDAFNGSILQTIALSMSGSTNSPAISDGWVWVEDYDGNVYGFFGQMPVGLIVSPSKQSRDVLPDSTVNYYVNVTNVGISGPDTFDATVELGAFGWTTELYESDGVTPLGDTDADGVPDTGSLPTEGTATIVIRVTVPLAVSAGDTETAAVRFTSSNDFAVNKTTRVTSYVPPPGVEITPGAYFPVNPGDAVTATMDVHSTGAFPDTIDITAWSEQGWLMGMYQADGVTPLDDTDLDGTPDTGQIPGLSHVTIVAQLQVPSDIEIGTVDRTYVLGVSSLDTNANDTNVVVLEYALPPDQEWPTFHNSNEHRGASPALSQPPVDPMWTDGPYYVNVFTGPVTKDGIVYSTTLDGYIRANDAWTGDLLWSHQIGSQDYYTGTPTVENGIVFTTFYTSSEEGYVCAFDAYTGARLWTKGPETGIDFNARIQMEADAGLVFGAAWSGEVFALNASTGDIVWSYNTGDLPYGAPTIAAGMVFIGTIYSYTMYAFDEMTGAVIWTQVLDGEIASASMVAQRMVFVGTYAGTMFALDMSTGDIVWTHDNLGTFFFSTPATDGATIYFGTDVGVFYALSALDGSTVWETATPGGWYILSSPAYANGYVYGTSGDGYLYVLDAATGEIVQSVYLESWESTSSPAVSEGWVWLQDYDGRLHAFMGQMPIGVLVTPSSQVSDVVPSSVVDYAINVTNIGFSGPDTFDATVALGPLGWTTELFESDGVTPLGDSDSDGIPDTGSLSSYTSASIIIRVTVPGDALAGDRETATIVFTSSNDVTVSKAARVTSFVPPPGVSIGPRQYFSLDPGDNATAWMEVHNTGAFPDTIDINTSSKIGWPMILLQGDCATPLEDTDSDGIPDTGLLPGLGSTEIVVVVQVPSDAEYGELELTEITGTSSLDLGASDSSLIIVELAGAGSIEWPTFHQNMARTGASPVPYELPLGSSPAWTYYGWNEMAQQGPIISGGNVYFTDWSGAVYSLNSATGALNWQRYVGDSGYRPGPLTAAYGYIYVAFAKNYGSTVTMFCLDEDTGSIEWSYSSAGWVNWTDVRTSPAVAAGMVFWTDFAGGMIYANDAFTGEPIWKRTVPGGGWATEGPTYWAGMVFCVDDLGDITALDAFTGDEIWSINIGVSIYSAPAVLDDKLLVGDLWGTLYALDPFTGEQRWTASGLASWLWTSTPTYGQGLIFLDAEYYSGAGSGMMWALDAETGSVEWSYATYGAFSSSAAYANGVVFAADTYGYLYGWDAATGGLLYQTLLGYSVYPTSVAVGDGVLVLGHSYGTVAAYRFAGALELERIEIVPGSAEVPVATVALFEARAYDKYGNPMSGIDFTWSSLNSLGSVMPLTGSGESAAYVAGGTAGIDTLRVTAEGHMANATVTIVAGALDHVVVTPGVTRVVVGETLQLSATAVDRFGNEIPGAAFTWEVTGGIGTVDTNGLFTAGTVPGVGTVNATTGIGTGWAVVEVVPGTLADIVVIPSPIAVSCGEVMLVEAQGYDAYGNEVPGLMYDWSTDIGTLSVVSAEKGIAQFTADEIPGTGELTVSAEDTTKHVAVTVGPGPLRSIAVTPDLVEVPAGGTVTMQATPMDIYGNAIQGLTVVWTASSALGSISQSGVLTASDAVGSGIITASIGSVSKSVYAKVVPGALASLTVSPSPLTVPAGSVVTLTAEAEDEYGNTIGDVDVSWTATRGTISPLSMEGTMALYLVPTAIGSATITATAGTVTETVSVTVTSGAIDHLIVSPDALGLKTGGSASLSVSAVDIYGNEVSVPLFSWTTTIGTVTPAADGSTADFDAGNKEGSGTITVTAGGKSASVAVSVSGGPQTLGEKMSQPSSIALLAAVIVLALIVLLLFMKNQQLGKKLAEGGKGVEPEKPAEKQEPPKDEVL
ncbi:MAG: outer membrane protein assembly factor BamB family protein [Thermoplasmata archaeon]